MAASLVQAVTVQKVFLASTTSLPSRKPSARCACRELRNAYQRNAGMKRQERIFKRVSEMNANVFPCLSESYSNQNIKAPIGSCPETYVAILDRPATMERVIGVNPPARAALLDFAYCFSPCVEAVEDGIVVADITGTEKLFGSPRKLVSTIATRAAEFGFALNIGIASNPDTAVHIARGYSGITIVEPGEEAASLATLPIEVLAVSPEMMEVLDAWGIRNCKALATLPSIPLVERLGQEGLKLQQLARGEVRRTLVPMDPPLEFIESFEFEDPVESLEGISFILNRLLQQLCIRLAARALATNELRLTLSLDVRQVNYDKRGEVYERAWKLPI